MNFSVALAETPREILIDGESFLLVKRSALDALYPSGAAGDRTTRSPVARAASPMTSRPAPKKLKVPSPRVPVARLAAAPKTEASKPENGMLRNAVLDEIKRSPGSTSLELFGRISEKISTTSGSVYQAVKAWVAKGDVEGRTTEAGPKGWYPARSTRKPAGGNRTTLDGPALHPNAPASHSAPSGPAEARGAA